MDMEKTAEQLRREHIALEGDTPGKNKWASLLTVLIMTIMVCLDASIVTVALPVMQKELGVGLDRIQLVSIAAVPPSISQILAATRSHVGFCRRL